MPDVLCKRKGIYNNIAREMLKEGAARREDSCRYRVRSEVSSSEPIIATLHNETSTTRPPAVQVRLDAVLEDVPRVEDWARRGVLARPR